MVKVREKKEINELETLHCRPSTKDLAKDNGVMERFRVGTKKGTRVAKMTKMGGITHDIMAVARTEAKGKEKVKEATTICTSLMKMTVKTFKKQLTMRKICKHGVCLEKVKMSSGKR